MGKKTPVLQSPFNRSLSSDHLRSPSIVENLARLGLLLSIEGTAKPNRDSSPSLTSISSQEPCISCLFMGTPREVYRDFMEKVKRTVFFDNLSPQVSAAVIKTALGQFGNVINVQFIPNYTGPRNIPKCALVELETAKQAQGIIEEMTNYPFMMSGMPRPVRARAAEIEMFGDRPKKPDRNTRCHWVDSSDQDFEVAKKLKDLVKKQAVEASLLLKLQLEEEEKLSKQQDEVLKANYKKFEMIDNVVTDKTLIRLASEYGMGMKDD